MKRLFILMVLVFGALYAEDTLKEQKERLQADLTRAEHEKEEKEKSAGKRVKNARIKSMRQQAQELLNDPILEWGLKNIDLVHDNNFKTREEITKAADFLENKYVIAIDAFFGSKGKCLRRRAAKGDGYDKIRNYCEAEFLQFAIEVNKIMLEHIEQEEKAAKPSK